MTAPEPGRLDAATLARLRELHEQATSGPWDYTMWSDYGEPARPVITGGHRCYEVERLSIMRAPDAALVIAAVNALPALLAAVEGAAQARTEVELLTRQVSAEVVETQRFRARMDHFAGVAEHLERRNDELVTELADARAALDRVGAACAAVDPTKSASIMTSTVLRALASPAGGQPS